MAAEEDYRELGFAVLESEVEMAGGGGAEVGDFGKNSSAGRRGDDATFLEGVASNR